MAHGDTGNSAVTHDRRRTGGRHNFALPGQLLTPREKEVCELLSAGLALKEVAYKMNISINTADYHRCNAYVKLGIHNRTELAKRFFRPQVEPQAPIQPDTASIAKRLDLIEERLEDLLERLARGPRYMPPLP